MTTHVKKFEDFLNEGHMSDMGYAKWDNDNNFVIDKEIKINKDIKVARVNNFRQIMIFQEDLEVGFSSDKNTLGHIINALEKAKADNDHNTFWWSVESKEGDVYIDFSREDLIRLIQNEDLEEYRTNIEIPVKLIDKVIDALKKI